MRFPDVLAMAVQQGGGAAASPYGPNLIVMGGSSWSQTNGTTISDDGTTLTYVAVGANNNNTDSTSAAIEAGATYLMEFTFTRTAGTVQFKVGATAATSRGATGSYSEQIVATDTTGPTLRTLSTTSGTLTSISCRKVL